MRLDVFQGVFDLQETESLTEYYCEIPWIASIGLTKTCGADQRSRMRVVVSKPKVVVLLYSFLFPQKNIWLFILFRQLLILIHVYQFTSAQRKLSFKFFVSRTIMRTVLCMDSYAAS